ncbi:hypothetical protein DUI87_27608 [Hirundo rustica rustica]|uniref:RNase H type-1 domain-containing protein n=1 Tax=Hirundo rustica rustica TaxID=333673 RepID=A0A3M0J9K5_HIRRU|nr:hypothetical protein DUI87_27608 [Hirundo rustica rustica]
MARVPQSHCSSGSEHPSNTQVHPRLEDERASIPHSVCSLKVKGGHWLSPQRFLNYQAVMVEQDDVEIVVTNIVNPASFLSGSMAKPVIHECLEAIEGTYSSCPDLKDTLLENAKTWSTDGSSYVISGRHAGYAVTMSREVIESGPLPTNTLAQKAEITDLTWTLELAKRKKVNFYTDSRSPQPCKSPAFEQFFDPILKFLLHLSDQAVHALKGSMDVWSLRGQV